MELTIIVDIYTDIGIIRRGKVVEYLGHVPGGYIKVSFCGRKVMIDPRFTAELSK